MVYMAYAPRHKYLIALTAILRYLDYTLDVGLAHIYTHALVGDPQLSMLPMNGRKLWRALYAALASGALRTKPYSVVAWSPEPSSH